MAVQADINIGFKGTVETSTWARIAGLGARYAVLGLNDLKVSIAPGDRTVTIAPGEAWGDGVLSDFQTSTSRQANSVSSGRRWDTVVVRRTWTPEDTPTGSAQLMILAGTSAKAISANRQDDPGVSSADQPIALIRLQAGQTQVQEVIDLRCWAGPGGLVARSEEALQYLGEIGSHVTIGRETWARTIDANGSAVWESLEAPQRIELYGAGGSIPGQPNLNLANIDGALIQAGSWSGTLGAWGQGRVTFPRPFPNGQLMCMAQWAGPGGHVQDRIVTVLPPGHRYGSGLTAQYGREAFVFRVADVSYPSQVANAFARINWIAIGW